MSGTRWGPTGGGLSSVNARCTHVTDTMRALLMDQLTEVWHEPLDDRLLLAPRSPAPILDRLLQQRAAER
ncbi:hypothetical protein AAGT00_16900 [Streptomyces cavourensis]|uniref:hypothetical protein n=1 Tax=Streptomyces bacillaris TaxID=68179 RepID=UPI0034604A71